MPSPPLTRGVRTPWLSHTLRALTAIAVLLSAALPSGCRGAPAHAPRTLADSVAQFSGEQGAHGWRYGYWDREHDVDGAYDPDADFELLPHFGVDPVNRLSGREEFHTGELWFLDDGRVFTSLWATGGHANGAVLGPPYAPDEQWAVRRWTSDHAGPVTVSGHAGKTMPWGELWSGEVAVRVVVDGETLHTASVGAEREPFRFDTELREGSHVDLLLGPAPSVGVADFAMTVVTRGGGE